jgi:hypothetical protein
MSTELERLRAALTRIAEARADERDIYWASGVAEDALVGAATETDGYRDAFYAIGELLGMTAMPISPKEAFETVMLPRLRQLLGGETSAVLSDGHTTRVDALRVADELHSLAEHFANRCEDEVAGRVSAGAAILEMLAVAYWPSVKAAAAPTQEWVDKSQGLTGLQYDAEGERLPENGTL